MLTLITATLNAGRYIEQSFASVPPACDTIQHIVVDGGSTDRTIEICKKFPGVESLVVPGCSIYDAWNIGVEHTRGDWIMFLNADDELAEGAAEIVAATFFSHPTADIVAGRALMIDRDAPTVAPRVLSAAPGGRFEVAQLALGVPAINAMAFRRSVFERHGRFDTIYRVAGDRAFLLRLALRSPPTVVATADAALYRYYSHPGSLTLKRGLEQRLRIAHDHVLLADQLLAEQPAAEAARVLRYWRRREAVVAALRCAAAGRPVAAWRFAGRLLARPRMTSDANTATQR
jgi:glycosyltransferase involved in cell wall biosynthesis